MKKLIYLILTVALIVSCSEPEQKIQFAEIRPVHRSVSPMITHIKGLDGTEKEAAVSALIEKGQSEGYPLVESDPLYEDYLYATLIYIDPTHSHDIEFEVYGIYDEYRFGEMKLYHLDSTDLYYCSYMVPEDICFSYRFILTDKLTGEKRTATDPLNSNRAPTGEVQSYSWSVFDLRGEEAVWYTKRHANTGSRLESFPATSRIMGNTRDIYVYLPPGYTGSDKNYPVIYLFDSFIYLNRIEVPTVLDNLISAGKLEPMIAVFIDNPTSTSRLTELPLNSRFRDFVVTELLTEIKDRYRITEKPDETAIGGISYGGLAASYIAFEFDSVFGKVLSQSGSFWRDLQLRDNGEEYRADWLINRYLVEEKRNLKLFLDWGLQEDVCLYSGRRMAQTLKDKGYEFKFMEFNGWHDWSNSRKTFPEGLLYLMEKR